MEDGMSLQYELERLRDLLSNARQENQNLYEQLESEKDRHSTTKRKHDELKSRQERAYDAYVTQTHEGYMPQEDYDALEKLIDKYEAFDIYVVEMRVRADWFKHSRNLYAEGEQKWRIVDHRGRPSNIAVLDKSAQLNLPCLDPGYEARCRHLLTGEVIKRDAGKPHPTDDNTRFTEEGSYVGPTLEDLS